MVGSIDTSYKSLKEIALDHIRNGIIEGRYPPGARMIEQGVADELGISRGPIREAMLQLEQDGLIQINPRRGAIVRTLSPAEAWEIYVLRGHLEALAVRLASKRWSQADSDRLAAIVDEMRALGPEDWLDAISLDLRFHHVIVDASGHEHLKQMYRLMDVKVGACFLSVKHHLDSRPNSMAERHSKLVEVLREGDFWRAELLAVDHWAETAGRFKALAQQ